AILDGWSVASLQTELMNEYFDRLQGTEPLSDAPKAKYRDFIAREQQSLQSADTREYWRGLLAGASLQTLPQARGGEQKGQDVATFEMKFDPNTCTALERLARELGVHVKTLLLAAHVKVMSVVSGESTVLTGVVYHGRL